MMQQAVSISNLRKKYGKILALQGVDLIIERGVIYGLLGPNGAGKSTLIKSIVGAVKPTSGNIEVLGQSMPGEAQSVRKRLGYMPQVPALYGDLSVQSNIRFFAGAHKLDNIKERVERIIDFVGLPHLASRKISTLSDGLKQRCSLACAMVHDPELLILDEPTAGVDPVLKDGFWQYFKELRSKGVTIIISTHLMDEPLACNRIGILREGSLLIEDTPENILSLGKIEVVIEGDMGTVVEEVKDYSHGVPRLLKHYGLRPGITNISLKQDSLEEIFLKIVQEGKKSVISG